MESRHFEILLKEIRNLRQDNLKELSEMRKEIKDLQARVWKIEARIWAASLALGMVGGKASQFIPFLN